MAARKVWGKSREQCDVEYGVSPGRGARLEFMMFGGVKGLAIVKLILILTSPSFGGSATPMYELIPPAGDPPSVLASDETKRSM